MPAERITMRKIREVLRLNFECGLTNRKIAKSASIARSTVGDYVQRARDAGADRNLTAGQELGTLSGNRGQGRLGQRPKQTVAFHRLDNPFEIDVSVIELAPDKSAPGGRESSGCAPGHRKVSTIHD